MDIRALRSFLRVAELGSFGQAAAVLNQTQPTISRQIAALEQDFGARLFTRHRHGVSLTPAGVLMRERAIQALRSLEQARADIAAQAETPSGTVALGMPPSLLSVLSGPLVESYARRHPRVLLHVYEAISQVLEALMLSQQVDLAVLISDRRKLRNVTLSPLGIEPLMLVGPPDADLDPAKTVGIERLAGLPLLSWRPPNHLRLLTESALRRRGLPFALVVELETLPLAIDLIARGVGYSVLPPSALGGKLAVPGGLTAAPIRGLSVTWTLGVNRDRESNPAVQALAAAIRAAAESLIARGAWRPAKRR